MDSHHCLSREGKSVLPLQRELVYADSLVIFMFLWLPVKKHRASATGKETGMVVSSLFSKDVTKGPERMDARADHSAAALLWLSLLRAAIPDLGDWSNLAGVGWGRFLQ